MNSLRIIILGYIGDRIGYRTVLIIALILSGLSATSFDWTPRFKEFHRIPTVTFNSTKGILFSNSWIYGKLVSF